MVSVQQGIVPLRFAGVVMTCVENPPESGWRFVVDDGRSCGSECLPVDAVVDTDDPLYVVRRTMAMGSRHGDFEACLVFGLYRAGHIEERSSGRSPVLHQEQPSSV